MHNNSVLNIYFINQVYKINNMYGCSSVYLQLVRVCTYLSENSQAYNIYMIVQSLADMDGACTFLYVYVYILCIIIVCSLYSSSSLN